MMIGTPLRYLILAVLLATGAPAMDGRAAERVPVRVGEHPGFSRIVFDWSRPVGARLERHAGQTVLRFDRVAELDLARFRADPPPEVSHIAARPEGDGLAVTLTVVPGAKTRLFESRGKTVLDVFRPDTLEHAPAETEPVTAAAQPGSPASPARPPSPAEPPQVAALQGPSALSAPISLLPPAPAPKRAEPATVDSAAKATDGKDAQAKKKDSKPLAPKRASQATAGPKPKAGPSRAATASTRKRPSATARQAAAKAAAPTPVPLSAERAMAGPTPVAGATTPVLIDTSPQPGRALSGGARRVLRFEWPDGVAAAAFRRNGKLWLVFDRPPYRDLTGDIGKAAPELEPVEHIRLPDATVLRFAAPARSVARLRRDDTAWIVELEPGVPGTETEIDVLVEGSAGQPRILFPVESAGRTVSFTDPDLGDRLIVVPLSKVGPGRRATREFPQFRVLASRQGLVFQPLSDGLRIAVTAKEVEVRDGAGLIVSRGASLALLKSNVSVPPKGPRLFDLEAARRGDATKFRANKQALQRALVLPASDRHGAARLELAQFYFAHGLASEALGALRLGEQRHPHLGSDPRVRLIKGAGHFLAEDFAGAARELYHPALAGEWEADLWRAALAAAGRNWEVAAAGFADTEALIDAYPKAVRARLRLLAAEARLALGDLKAAERYLQAAGRDDPSHAEEAQVAFLEARRLHLDGDTAGAKALWQRVAKSKHAPSQIRARLALFDLALEEGSVSADQAIEELERLRFAWRGDRFEFAILQRLGDLYILRKDYGQGLRLLRRAVSQNPDSTSSQAVASRMRAIFAKLFGTEPSAVLPPLRALALFEEFKELTPPGADGDEVILRLAERLVDVDLLERAAEVLDAQVRYRLHGPAKAGAAARLAQVYLLNQEPAKALEALDASELSDLPEDLIGERRLLRAQALLDLDRQAEALAALGADEGVGALRLRARILWRREDWPATALALERLVPAFPPAEGPLGDAEAEDVVNLAVALTMAGERKKILALGRAYTEAMARGPHKETFTFLVGDLEPGRVKSIAEELAQVEEVEAFLASYRKRSGARDPATTQ